MTRRSSEAGFTLLELMATVVCITVLAAVATPRLSGYVRQGRLEAAKPYLAQIAARERMYRIESGQYCCTTSGTAEDNLVAGLGVALADTGDFCFVFVCQSTTLCQSVSGSGFISPSASAPDFEVWAILQDATPTTNPGPGGTACTPATGKAAGTGFVAAATSASAGRGGQVVVLRYPPPVNGIGANGTYHAVPMDWRDGVSISDAMSP
ncbi:MAG: type IV pilin protein [Janthinobacterium lividum]